MQSVGWGRGGGPAWAAGGRLPPGAPARSELRGFVVEVLLTQGWRRGCLHPLVLVGRWCCGRPGASNPVCAVDLASGAMPVLQGAGNGMRSAGAWGSGRSRPLPGRRYPTNKEQAPHGLGWPPGLAPAWPAPALQHAGGWPGGLCSVPSIWRLSETPRSFFFAMPKQILADY